MRKEELCVNMALEKCGQMSESKVKLVKPWDLIAWWYHSLVTNNQIKVVDLSYGLLVFVAKAYIWEKIPKPHLKLVSQTDHFKNTFYFLIEDDVIILSTCINILIYDWYTPTPLIMLLGNTHTINYVVGEHPHHSLWCWGTPTPFIMLLGNTHTMTYVVGEHPHH
jgi:hypothetical protein